MSRATVELDFLGIGNGKSSSSANSNSKSLTRRTSFRGIQSAISRFNPELVKSVIASASSSPKAKAADRNASLTPLPIYVPVLRSNTNNVVETCNIASPLTIFYNGTVSIFDVSPDKADMIMKLAKEATSKAIEPDNKNGPAEVAATALSASADQQQLLGALGGDLPLFRRKSFLRFLEKRKERLTSLSPYGNACACDASVAGRGFTKNTTAATTTGVGSDT